MKIRFYLHNTIGGGFTQMALWPVIYITHNKMHPSHRLLALSANVLFWDFGFTIGWNKYE